MVMSKESSQLKRGGRTVLSLLGLAKSKKEGRPNDLQGMNAGLYVNEDSLLKKMNMMGFTEVDLKLVKQIQPLVKKNIDYLAEDFYASILRVDHLKEIIEQHSTVERLKQTLRVYIIELFNGDIDQAFLEKRFRIAEAHFRIGLESTWYMAAFQNVQKSVISLILDKIRDRKSYDPILSAVNKIFSLEQQIVLEAYEIKRLESRFEEGKAFLKNKMTAVSEELLALVEQTEASVEELSSNIHEVGLTASQSNKQAISANKYASNGQQKLDELLQKNNLMEALSKEMIEHIHQLGESSNQISSVIHIVQDIAEQTNILALNSAIEAARAGEHGRGFAVLAEEVQRLAEQTKRSIVQIHHLISASNAYREQVEASLMQVEDAVQSSILSSEHTQESFRLIVQSIQQNGATVLKVEEQMNKLIQVADEIKKAISIVASSAEQLNEAAIKA